MHKRLGAHEHLAPPQNWPWRAQFGSDQPIQNLMHVSHHSTATASSSACRSGSVVHRISPNTDVA